MQQQWKSFHLWGGLLSTEFLRVGNHVFASSLIPYRVIDFLKPNNFKLKLHEITSRIRKLVTLAHLFVATDIDQEQF